MSKEQLAGLVEKWRDEAAALDALNSEREPDGLLRWAEWVRDRRAAQAATKRVDADDLTAILATLPEPGVVTDARKVGCERDDGTLNIHSENVYCAVCAPAATAGEVVGWKGHNPSSGDPVFSAREPVPTVVEHFGMRPLVYSDAQPAPAAQGFDAEAVALLPLPRTLQHADDADLATHVQEYARANVAHATAELQAEIEALRAELEIAKNQAEFYRTTRNWNQQKAERLAEALLELCNVIDGHEVPVAVEAKAAHARDALRDHDQEVSNG